MPLAHDDGWAIPFDAPFYPMLPAWYRDVLFHEVHFTADPAAVARLLPEPLVASPGGECVAIGIRIPFSTAYGAFNEAAVTQRCLLGDQAGWYTSHVWHDGPRGIAAGREIYGTPKIFSAIEILEIEAAITTRASMGGVPVITITTAMEEAIEAAALPDLTPSWRLKIIPRADRPGPAIKQLIDGTAATGNLAVRASYRGRGTVAFETTPFGDLTGLRPIEVGEAYSYIADYSEGFATIALDYLAGE